MFVSLCAKISFTTYGYSQLTLQIKNIFKIKGKGRKKISAAAAMKKYFKA